MPVEIRKVSRFELLMDAGSGAQKAGDILIRAFANTGRFVFIEPMIPAEISPPPRTKPALSGAIIRVASYDLKNIGNDTDVILAGHEIVLDRRLDDREHNKHCHVLLDIGEEEAHKESYEQVRKRVADLRLSIHPFQITNEAKSIIKSLGGRGRNMYYLGVLSSVYAVPEEAVINEIKNTFGARLKEEVLNKNIDVFHLGFQGGKKDIDFSFDVPKAEGFEGEKILIDGNTAISMGIIDAGIKMYSGYPITPASSIMHTLAKELPSHGGMVHQAEDEIAAIGTAIGSYFGGTPSVTGTSGPGLSLKQEFIGYASAAEAPVIIIDVQRAGPSTGMPTKTEQSDLLPVIFGAHGDFSKAVISVGNVRDCFYAPHLARYLTETMRLPVFIMSDFMMANSYKVIPKPETVDLKNAEDIPDFILDHFWLDRLPDNLENTRLEQSVPGTPGHRRMVTGLNTDKTGSVNYFAGTNHRSHAIRSGKVQALQRALKHPEMFGSVTDSTGGDVLIVGWGSTRGVIAEAVHDLQAEGCKVSGMCFRIIFPLPLMLAEIFERFRYVVTVEMSYGDPQKKPALARLLRAETRYDVQSIICRATGRPIAPRNIKRKAKILIEHGLSGLDEDGKFKDYGELIEKI